MITLKSQRSIKREFWNQKCYWNINFRSEEVRSWNRFQTELFLLLFCCYFVFILFLFCCYFVWFLLLFSSSQKWIVEEQKQIDERLNPNFRSFVYFLPFKKTKTISSFQLNKFQWQKKFDLWPILYQLYKFYKFYK